MSFVHIKLIASMKCRLKEYVFKLRFSNIPNSILLHVATPGESLKRSLGIRIGEKKSIIKGLMLLEFPCRHSQTFF